ncbi:MAG: hypothetical protein AB7F89_22150 [Pirellulaceae bacterium]
MVEVAKVPDCILKVKQAHQRIATTWRDGGWAPPKAAELLRGLNLDRLVSLAASLEIWTKRPPADQEEGRLVLSWANLGALVEGTMCWFLCVHEDSYAESPLINKRGDIIAPDDIWFARLIDFFTSTVLDPVAAQRWRSWLDMVRERRNSIHAYRRRDLGTFQELRRAIRQYADFLGDLQSRVPDEPAPD